MALTLTLALTVGSFAMSFDALRSFAMVLGVRASLSWVWPAVIDVAIAHATLCLLSLTRPGPNQVATVHRPARASDGRSPHPTDDPPDEVASGDVAQESAEASDSAPTPLAADARSWVPAPGAIALRSVGSPSHRPGDRGDRHSRASDPALVMADRRGVDADEYPVNAAQRSSEDDGCDPQCASLHGLTVQARRLGGAADRWQPVAESLVRDGVTSKDPSLVAKILADNEAGTPPSTIGRRHEVHHTTVNRILSAAEQLVDPSLGTG
jgi:hypothetical protein